MSVFNLNSVPEEEREHFIFCPDCRIYIDCRDLGEVFDHIHDFNLENISHNGWPGITTAPIEQINQKLNTYIQKVIQEYIKIKSHQSF